MLHGRSSERAETWVTGATCPSIGFTSPSDCARALDFPSTPGYASSKVLDKLLFVKRCGHLLFVPCLFHWIYVVILLIFSLLVQPPYREFLPPLSFSFREQCMQFTPSSSFHAITSSRCSDFSDLFTCPPSVVFSVLTITCGKTL